MAMRFMCANQLNKRLLLVAYLFTAVSTSCAQPIQQDQSEAQRLGDIACATFMFVAGSWLAHKQLPRLAGQQIEFNAPVFTKVGASLLFGIGITGGIVGAYQLVTMIREKLNTID